ncbi:MAG: hypothetical protein DI621_19160 [Pseudomonas protegens]|nr:MAG: hypothetical protein DI621_19160 [Pseudomonas protegens]
MKNIVIETYIKQDNKYISIFDLDGNIADPDYIEGALVLSINGVSLIDLSMYDYIDELWCYLSEGLSLIHEGKNFSCFFPDQPIEVKFICLNREVRVIVNCHEEVKIDVNKDYFLMSMSNHARAFFNRLMEIEPSSKESSMRIISCLNEIKL